MTAQELYRFFLRELIHTHKNDEASNITSMIFEHFAGIDKGSLIKYPQTILEDKKVENIIESLALLKRNKPVQYITGEAWFYKMKFKVSPAVLIPRPETEELVHAVIAEFKNKQGIEIIDIGTGSGCIAVALKKNIPGATVTAIDISDSALKIAGENAASQQTNINFRQLDFLSKDMSNGLGNFDVIVSNPPYIPHRELKTMDKNVIDYEPHIALFVDNDEPLIFYKRIKDFAKDHLNVGGRIFLETHEDLAGEVYLLFNGNYKAIVKNDLFGKQRMVIITHYP